MSSLLVKLALHTQRLIDEADQLKSVTGQYVDPHQYRDLVAARDLLIGAQWQLALESSDILTKDIEQMDQQIFEKMAYQIAEGIIESGSGDEPGEPPNTSQNDSDPGYIH